MVYVTHDQVEAMTLGDRIAVLDKGVLQQVADPATLYHHPANRFVAGFIGSPPMNFVTAQVGSDGRATLAGGETFATEGAPASLAGHRGRGVTLGVRPEDLALAPNGASAHFDAVLDVREPLGNEVLLHWSTASGPLTSRLAGSAGPGVGEKVRLHVPIPQLRWFDSERGAAIA
jgi:multiple sugar transport system ATP-binding protein